MNTSSEDACVSMSTFNESERPIHIGAIFILLCTSLVATVFPLFAKRFPAFGFPRFGILIGKHIGTGVILALAFIHLLPPAIDALTSECLPEPYQNYSYAPLIAMISALAMQLIDNTLHGYHHIHEHGPEAEKSQSEPQLPVSTDETVELTTVASIPIATNTDTSQIINSESSSASVQISTPQPDPLATRKPVALEIIVDGNKADLIQTPASPPSPSPSPSLPSPKMSVKSIGGPSSSGSSSSSSSSAVKEEDSSKKNMMTSEDWSRTVSTYLLELACTMHSVIIGSVITFLVTSFPLSFITGITLGVAGDEFKTLLAALTFHQFFEGFALGTRICDLGLGFWNEIVLAFIYSISAPVGTSIGVGISTSYNASSTDALLTQGIFDAISAGILFYMAFVTLMSVDFREDTKLLTSFRKGVLYVCVYFGATIMAVIGTWL